MFSPSGLSVFTSCKRCFWMEKNKQSPRPRGIFPSLPGGMDGVIKRWMDATRGAGGGNAFPYGLSLFPDQKKLDVWRNWRTGLKTQIAGVVLGGAIDDLLVDEKGTHFVMDYKTKGSAPKPGDTEKYYQLQADCYMMLLRANGLAVGDKAFFLYYNPSEASAPRASNYSDDVAVLFSFQETCIEIGADPERAVKTAMEAKKCLEGDLPEPGAGCEYCAFVESRASTPLVVSKEY